MLNSPCSTPCMKLTPLGGGTRRPCPVGQSELLRQRCRPIQNHRTRLHRTCQPKMRAAVCTSGSSCPLALQLKPPSASSIRRPRRGSPNSPRRSSSSSNHCPARDRCSDWRGSPLPRRMRQPTLHRALRASHLSLLRHRYLHWLVAPAWHSLVGRRACHQHRYRRARPRAVVATRRRPHRRCDAHT